MISMTLGTLAQLVAELIEMHGVDQPICLYDCNGDELTEPFNVSLNEVGELEFEG